MNWKFWQSEKRNVAQEIPQENQFGMGLGMMNLQLSDQIPAVSLSAVFAAIEIISNSLAELPLNVKTRQDNKSTLVKNHPLYHIFDNCIMTKYMMIKMLVTDMLLYGNGVAYIERATDGTPTNLVYCPHGTYSIIYNEQSRSLYYLIPSLRKGRIEPIDVVHILKNSLNGVEGRGILFYANHTLKLTSSTEKAAQDYFSSGMHVSGILRQVDVHTPLNDKQRNSIRESWRQGHSKNGTGICVIEGGLEYQPVSSNSKDAQLLESRLFNLQDVARFFNINPVLLGDLSHSSYSTIEASLLEFVTHTLYPYITLIENELKRKLVKPSEKNLYIDLDAGFILKSDKTSQANYLNTLKQAGIITTNEAREQLGLNPVEGGDKLMVAYSDVNQNTVGEQAHDRDNSITDNGDNNSANNTNN